MNDSTLMLQSIPDSLKIILHSNSQFPVELVGLIGVALGALISIIGNWMLAKRQMHFEIQKALFQRKLDIYLKLTELLWPGGIRQHDKNSTIATSTLRPYRTNKDLSKWLNDLTLFIAANRLIIDQKSLTAYEKLSDEIIKDLKYIGLNSTPATIDKKTREVGIQSANNIMDLCGNVHNAGWDYFRKNYSVEL